MCTEAKARAFRPEDKELDDDTHVALKYIGVVANEIVKR